MKYFDCKNRIGYVDHEKTDNQRISILISFGPYIIMMIIGLVLFTSTTILYKSEGETYLTIISLLTMWFFVSILSHSSPFGFDFSNIETILKRIQMEKE